MSAAVTAFDPSIVYSPPRLERFFKAEATIHTLRTQREGPRLRLSAETGYIPVELQALCKQCYACAWAILSFLSYCVGATDFYKRFAVYAMHAQSHAEIMRIEQQFGAQFLASSINAYQENQEDLFLQPTNDSELLGQEYGFFDYHGLCRGMANWFLYLYFKAQIAGDDPIAHMRKITSMFSNGAPQEAALLHLLDARIYPAGRFLPLRFVENFKRFSTAGLNIEQIASQFYALPAGVYTVFSSSHQFNFIKLREDLCFVYNPMHGSFVIDDLIQLERVLVSCLASHNYRSELLIDKVYCD